MDSPTIPVRVPQTMIKAARESHPELAYLPLPVIMRAALIMLTGKDLHSALREATLPRGPKHRESVS